MIAYDADSPKNSEIIYEIVNPNGAFTIEPSTGIVKATKSFDYEAISSVDLTVRARNPGSRQYSQTILTVEIQGENEYFSASELSEAYFLKVPSRTFFMGHHQILAEWYHLVTLIVILFFVKLTAVTNRSELTSK